MWTWINQSVKIPQIFQAARRCGGGGVNKQGNPPPSRDWGEAVKERGGEGGEGGGKGSGGEGR
jgi:hypothetical protein